MNHSAAAPDDRALIQLNDIKHRLLQVRDMDELVNLHAQAIAYEAYFRTQRARRQSALDDENLAAEIRVRIERDMGRRLQETVQHGGDRKSKSVEATLISTIPDGITRDQSSAYQRMANVPDSDFEQHLASAKESKERITTKSVVEIGRTPHVTKATGENEWYTPPAYIEAARTVMGGIDCDPASSEIANKTVKATTFYTKETDGLRPAAIWGKRVFCNPPYSQPLIAHFTDALVARVQAGEVERAIVLVNNATETDFFQKLLAVARAVCFPKARIRFLDPNGEPSGAPLQGQAILYIGGSDGDGFADAFDRFGKVLFA